jgi:heme A synthase
MGGPGASASLDPMENFATRFADLLEDTATKIRALTVDRVEKGVRVAALALPTVVFGLLAVIFLFMTLHAALAVPLGSAAAHAIIAGLFAVGAALLWAKRTQDETQ